MTRFLLALALACSAVAAAGAAQAVRLELVKDICPGGCPGALASNAANVAWTKSRLFFIAADNNAKYPDNEVWSTDGTANGTFRLVDSVVGLGGSDPHDLTAVGDRVYFVADRNGWGAPYEQGLYESDGTPEGTRHIPFPDLAPDQIATGALTPWGSELWLYNGGSVWRVAGAGAAPERITGFESSLAFVEGHRFAIVGQSIYEFGWSCRFCYDEPLQLWRIDRDGTKRVVDGLPAISLNANYDLRAGTAGLLVTVNNRLFRIDVSGRVDALGPSGQIVLRGDSGGRAYFVAGDAPSTSQLWSTDGTPAGTRQETRLRRPGDTRRYHVTPFRGDTLVATRLASGDTFARLDRGHPEGARQIRSLRVDGWYGDPPLVVHDDRIYMGVEVGNAMALWASDGTTGGTRPIDLPGVGKIVFSVAPLASIGGWLYVKISDNVSGHEIWRMRVTDADVAPVPVTHVVEYYNARRDHYFLTARTDEIAILDAGKVPEWARTGKGFMAYDSASGGHLAVPVCRFYGLPAFGLDSHFYTAFPEECDYVVQHFSGAWLFEDPDAFGVAQSDGYGTCPAGFVPLFRTFNTRSDINHRYTTDDRVQTEMMMRGWRREGFGPNGVAMCVLAKDDQN